MHEQVIVMRFDYDDIVSKIASLNNVTKKYSEPFRWIDEDSANPVYIGVDGSRVRRRP